MAILKPRWLLTAAVLLVVHATNAQRGMEIFDNLTQWKRSIAEKEYGNLLSRAQKRREVGERSSEAGRKYTSEHTDLVNDVVRSYNKALSLSGQHKVLQRLILDLGILPMTKGTFCERAGAIRKEIGYCGKAGAVFKSHVGIENSRILDSVFEANPKISTKEAFDALQEKLKGQLSTAPTLLDVRHWLKYRKSRMRGARLAGGHSANVTEGRVDQKSTGSFNEEVYKNLLHRAQERRKSVENVSLRTNGYRKYTAEHYALMDDVVRSCDEFYDHCGLFEVFQKVLSDMGMGEVNRNTFNSQLVELRKRLRGETETSKISSSAHLLKICQGMDLENKIGEKHIEASEAHVTCSSSAESSVAEDFDSFWSEVLSVIGPDDANFI